jgi:hypothetical protein
VDGGTSRTFVFFYGLFMDEDLLRGRGLAPSDVAPAVVDGFGLRVGNRADLVRAPAERAYGVVMSLSLAELDRLYADPSVRAYRSRIVTARRLDDGTAVTAQCYTLPEGTVLAAPDPAYLEGLREIGVKVGLPAPFLEALGPPEQ